MPPEENVESTLIWYKGTERNDYKHWASSLEKFLEGRTKETKIEINSNYHRTTINLVLKFVERIEVWNKKFSKNRRVHAVSKTRLNFSNSIIGYKQLKSRYEGFVQFKDFFFFYFFFFFFRLKRIQNLVFLNE